ncbi:MAG: pyruvate dehydrogenase (acetyl-transferring) E1 component subunit alpha [Gammaproteobacteria bacterium]|nr:pyruvate dehydrogenase (acetyl-transferring) E1 component subunit alpha [Gammaproteobacteria bacterium]
MSKLVAEFSIEYHQYLNAESKVVDSLPEFAKNFDHLKKLYKHMVLTRTFDTKAIALQRTGKLGTYASSLGQEAIPTGIGMALNPDDVFLTFYRGYGTQFLRGVTMEEVFLYWGGSEAGNNFKAASAKEDFPMCVPIGSQYLHAVGVATAFKLRHQKRAVLVTCGDGATSQGDVYEAMNVAGAWNLPVVFIIENNQWAISVPREKQTHAKTLAQKGIAAGIDSEQIDGNDIIAVQERISHALNKARNGNGPTVIEAITYRLSDHTTADDASRYRNKDIIAKAWQEEPVVRLRNYLAEHKQWDETQEKQWLQECSEKIEKAVANYLNTPPEPKENMFNYHYANMPASLIAQRDKFL